MFVTNLNLQISHTIFTLSLRWQGEPLNRPGGQYETEMAKAKKKRKNRSMCATEYRLYQIITRGTKRKKKRTERKQQQQKHTGGSFAQAHL